jgi:hypothetical protein
MYKHCLYKGATKTKISSSSLIVLVSKAVPYLHIIKNILDSLIRPVSLQRPTTTRFNKILFLHNSRNQDKNNSSQFIKAWKNSVLSMALAGAASQDSNII